MKEFGILAATVGAVLLLAIIFTDWMTKTEPTSEPHPTSYGILPH